MHITCLFVSKEILTKYKDKTRIQISEFSQAFTEYFKEVEEESIRDNFVIVYELLDEFMDFGYPQTTDPKVLQELVFEIVLSKVLQVARIECNFGIIPSNIYNIRTRSKHI